MSKVQVKEVSGAAIGTGAAFGAAVGEGPAVEVIGDTGGGVGEGAVAALSGQFSLAAAGVSFEDDAGRGSEGVDKDSIAIPFISILQPLSPIVAEGETAGAKAGLFINSITQEMSSEIYLIPVAFKRSFLRWQPRKLGGGFKGQFDPIAVETRTVPDMLEGPDGKFYIGGIDKDVNDQLRDTRQHFVLVVKPDGTYQPAMVSMSSTQIKRSKRWIARMQGIQLPRSGDKGGFYNPPTFSHIYRCTTVKESNDQGIWWSWEIDVAGPVTSADVYAAAKAFNLQVIAGKVETAPPVDDEAGAGGDASEKF